jgi:hypothetical protein
MKIQNKTIIDEIIIINILRIFICMNIFQYMYKILNIFLPNF